MSLLDKLKKNSTSKSTAILTESKVLKDREFVTTSVPAINIALSGAFDGGMSSGAITIAGESRSFKTGIALVLAAAYQKQYPEAAILFYDSEFGSPNDYFKSAGIDLDRVIHTPITNIEDLKFDLMQQLNGMERGDKVFILVDSLGNLASKKEVEDALDGKSVADMTRAKQMKSFFRMVTPILTLKNLPMVVINHTYKTIELYAKDVVSGGTGGMYSSNIVWIIKRSQEKDSDGLNGFTFKINVEKSRFVKEKSVIPVTIYFDQGIQKTSGLLDLGMELGFLVKPNVGWYSFVDIETGEPMEKKYRAAQLLDFSLWKPYLNDPDVKKLVEQKYKLAQVQMLSDEEVAEEFAQTE